MEVVHHIGYTVSDLARSERFYTNLLQCEPVERERYSGGWISRIVGYEGAVVDCVLYEIPGSSLMLELLEYQNPAPKTHDMETYNVGNVHWCVKVPNLQEEHERLRGLGVTLRSGPVNVLEDEGAEGERVLYVRDPDGISIEFLEEPA